MRRLYLVVALASGCVHPRTSEPAWPKPHASERDGGESLAPRHTAQVATSVERTADAKLAVAATPATTAPTTTAKPADAPLTPVISPVIQPTEETITTEDIVIEIED